MSVFDQIEQLAQGEVEAGGLRWRIRRIHSETVREGQALLIAIATPNDEDIVQEQMIMQLPETEQAAQRERYRGARLARMLTPENLARSAANADAVVMAAVTAVWDTETEAWEPIAIAADGEAVDRLANPPRLPLHLIAVDTRKALYEAAWALSTNGGADADRLARFRDGPRIVPRNGADVPDVRPPSA